MSKHIPRTLQITLLCCAFSLTTTLARAEPTEDEQQQAEEHFQQGVALHDEGDYRAALIEFSQAYKLAPTYHLLYNLGQESTALKEYVEAHRSFVQYLEDGGDNIDSDRRADVQRKISQLKKYLATVEFKISVAGAEVAIDGIVVGVSPLTAAIDVSLGRRKIVVTREGHSRWERTIDVAGGDEKTVEVQLLSLGAVSTPQARSSQNTAFWLSAGATGVFLAGTGVALVLTNNAKSDHQADIDTIGDVSPEDKLKAIASSGDKYKRMALYTDIGIGLTVLSAATTIWLASRDDNDSEESPRSSSVQMQVGLSNIGISGRF